LTDIVAAHAGAVVNAEEIRGGGAPLQELSESPSIHFVAIGDWGASLTSSRQRRGQQVVADGVASWLDENKNNNGKPGDENNNGPFILSLGDNFYPSGVKDLDDMEERFAQSFDDVYSHDAFDNVPWYVVAGNKDYEGDISAQMNYTGSSRWIFPDYFHKVVREIEVPGENLDRNSIKVEIVAIDTMVLAGSPSIEIDMITSNNRLLRDTAEFQWIQHQLSHSDADYLIVAGHFPAHPGLNGLLQKYEVSAYVSGHIHCQKHKRKNGIDHFTSGAGMELDCKKDDIDHKDATGGFLSFDANARVDKLNVTFHDQDGNEIHSTDIRPRVVGKNVSVKEST